MTGKILNITQDKDNVYFDVKYAFPKVKMSTELIKDLFRMKDVFINGNYDKDIYLENFIKINDDETFSITKMAHEHTTYNTQSK